VCSTGVGMRVARLGLAVLLTACLAQRAGATTFVPMDDETLQLTSAVIISGTVKAIESARPAPDQALYTYVHVHVDEVLQGHLGGDTIVLREPGGRVSGRSEWVFGAPEFSVGERAVLFLTRNPDGTLRTNQMAMGKYTVAFDASGTPTAVREFGPGTAAFIPASGEIAPFAPQRRPLGPLLAQVRQRGRSRARGLHTNDAAVVAVPPELAQAPTEVADSFTYLGTPSRWMLPDCGQPVRYFVDSVGDATLGFTASRTAVDAAFAAWSSVPGANLQLVDAGTIAPTEFAGCGENRVVFNDPFNEITDPTNCTGVLAMGGYCSGDTLPCAAARSRVNGTTFGPIEVGKVMFNNGWSGCSFWRAEHVGEIATHEIGHTLGFGHSADSTATMYGVAHFDGRGASLRTDDENAVRFVYPPLTTPDTRTPTPTITQTPTRTATPSRTATRTRTPSRTPIPTTTRTPTRTATNTPSATPTRTHSPTRTATTTATFSATVPPTVTGTATPTIPATATATATDTPTATPTPVLRVDGTVEYYARPVAVPGATLTLTGPATVSSVTDATGHFSLDNLAVGGWQLQAAKAGAINGAVTALDAAYVLQATVDSRQLDALQAIACDASGNGTITAFDASLILQYSVGLAPSLPVSAACGMEWSFVPVPAPVPNQTVLAPSLAGTACTAGRIAYDPLTAPAAGQNFLAMVHGDCTGNWDPSDSGPVTPPGTVAIRGGSVRRTSSGRRVVTVPITVSADAGYLALDVQLGYDAARLTPRRVRRAAAPREALVVMHGTTPGEVSIALASPVPIPNGVSLIAEFELRRATSPRGAVSLRRAQVGSR